MAPQLEELYERLVVPTLDPAIDRWLAVDFGDSGDMTTAAFIPPDVEARAEIRSRAHGVICGLPIVRRIASRAAGTLETEQFAVDGDRVEPGMRVMEIRGPLSSMLEVERTLLNLLGRASGVATTTSRFVEAVAGTGATIVDTRKTTPGLRAIEKYAVRCGGGGLHRIGLHDAVLIKDNHLAGIGVHSPSRVRANGCREQMRPRFIEIEVDTRAVRAGDRPPLGDGRQSSSTTWISRRSAPRSSWTTAASLLSRRQAGSRWNPCASPRPAIASRSVR